MVLVIDAQIAGISGDMFLCALVDLGADKNAIINGLQDSAKLLDGSSINSIEFRQARKSGLSAVGLNLDAHDVYGFDSSSKGRKGTDVADAIASASSQLQLSDAAAAYASRCIDILLDSESKVHGVSKDSVIFHEASCVDTLVDVVGTAIALDNLQLLDQRMVCLPVCVGGGAVKFSHGVVSNPASSIVEIFQEYGIWMRGSDAGSELVTPTGACMLAALRPDMVEFYPHMQINSIGYGAGQKDFDNFANVLKLVRGFEPYASARNHIVERVCVIESNIDDVSGEILGNMVNKMMRAGAKDVSICPGLTKKNRPVSLISVMCDVALSEPLIDLLISETGTMGVRVSESQRITTSREQHRVNLKLFDKQFDIRYKRRSSDNAYNDTAVDFKIEFDDLQMVSDATNTPIRKIEPVLREMIMKMDVGSGNVGATSDTDAYIHNNSTANNNKEVDQK